MKLAVDVHCDSGGAQAAAVAFEEWSSPEASRTYTTRVADVGKAPPRGALDLRKLPCLLQLLADHALEPAVILIDGFVHLDAQETPGLGQHLYRALGGRSAVIGLSRAPMADTPAQFEVFREEEAGPVVITCAGIDLGAAKARVRAMHGKRRVPTLLKLVARIAKGGAG